MSTRDEWEYFLTDEGRRVVEAFMAEGGRDDDVDIAEIVARNHADAVRDWFGGDGPIPARGDLR